MSFFHTLHFASWNLLFMWSKTAWQQLQAFYADSMPRPENYWRFTFIPLMWSLLMAPGTFRTSADLGTSRNNHVSFQRQLLVLGLNFASGYHSLGCDSKPWPGNENSFLSLPPLKHLWVKSHFPQCCPPNNACICSGAQFSSLTPGLI